MFVYILVHAQEKEPSIGFLPETALTYKLGSGFELIGKVESRHDVYESVSDSGGSRSGHDLTDLQGFLSLKLHPLWKVSGGYQYRLNAAEANSHRTIQQLTYLADYSAYRLIHRLRTDQTFYRSEEIKWRGRYRLALELPFEGRSIDAGEYYMVMSIEPIYSYQDNESDLENRLVAVLGHAFRGDTKIEGGIDYRVEKLEESADQIIWLKLGCYWSL